jgi:hypothetical protein
VGVYAAGDADDRVWQASSDVHDERKVFWAESQSSSLRVKVNNPMIGLALHVYGLLHSLRKTARLVMVSHSTIARWQPKGYCGTTPTKSQAVSEQYRYEQPSEAIPCPGLCQNNQRPASRGARDAHRVALKRLGHSRKKPDSADRNCQTHRTNAKTGSLSRPGKSSSSKRERLCPSTKPPAVVSHSMRESEAIRDQDRWAK